MCNNTGGNVRSTMDYISGNEEKFKVFDSERDK